MLQSIPGIYKGGKVELNNLPSNLSESPVIVTFLESNKAQVEKQIMQFGMFSGNKLSTAQDFQLAEFRGDTEDGLDW
jgi:hypothetical protein